jgi:hypothetical protein
MEEERATHRSDPPDPPLGPVRRIDPPERDSMRPRNRSSIAAGVVAIALMGAVGCDAPGTTAPEGLEADLNASVHARTAQDDLLKAVRQATARFHSPVQAVRAGYAADDHCVAHPELGGMGFHWVNQDLVDPHFDPLKPEVLLYASGPSGQPQLVAVEYVVIDVGQEHPHFGDHPFDVGGTPVPVDHWSLHVWLYEDNPSGTFAPFNPNVSCP